MGVLIEQIIEKAVPKSAIFAKIGMILLCLLAAFLMIYTSFGPYAFISLVALIYLTVLVFRNYDAEYEYEYLEGELTVDKIMAKKYRKRMGEFDFKRLEVMAEEGNAILNDYKLEMYKHYDYSSGFEFRKRYVALIMSKDEKVVLTFEPNEELYEAILKMAPKKVFE
ncbi:MAG: hypothetical protein IKL73_08740 [Lachnospiraceae bacterium]|nr:hypothetical protein [Lachnospiraceae bacterium]